MDDRIEREIWIDAAPERVWHVVTAPEHLRTWLGPIAVIELHEGGAVVFPGDESCGAERFEGAVEVVDAPRRLAFRWQENGWVEGGSTRVELVLEPTSGGTRLRVVESGFASLDVPNELRQAYLDQIGGGWRMLLDRIAEAVRTPAGEAHPVGA